MAAGPQFEKAVQWHMDEAEWNAGVASHWTSNSIEADDNEGVLGGWGEVDEEDAKGSLAFISTCLRNGTPIDQPISDYRALDCGAGVGRVTGNVLLHVAEQVHLVEVSERLLGQAQKQVRVRRPNGRTHHARSTRETAAAAPSPSRSGAR